MGGWPGCVVWQVAYIVIARTHWRHYGDAAFLAEHWDGMVALMGYFERHINPEIGLNQQACYGDWVDPGGHNPSTVTPASTVTAFYYVLALGQLSEMATALGRAADAQSYGIKHNEGVAVCYFFNVPQPWKVMKLMNSNQHETVCPYALFNGDVASLLSECPPQTSAAAPPPLLPDEALLP